MGKFTAILAVVVLVILTVAFARIANAQECDGAQQARAEQKLEIAERALQALVVEGDVGRGAFDVVSSAKFSKLQDLTIAALKPGVVCATRNAAMKARLTVLVQRLQMVQYYSPAQEAAIAAVKEHTTRVHVTCSVGVSSTCSITTF